ncbi:hypothetical protein llap_13779 [Limosa lapponica baueri]|uniref:Uncharacterized protein n=1 Tax=Limosa lapponica baueri TaxID=1758121 RepID=A0A2I0TQ52_LIMLA|nr:hypothetical protein llap_13779 [Limosa lapponica baueri]
MECMAWHETGCRGANLLDLLQEDRQQEGRWGENFCHAQMKLFCSPCAELVGKMSSGWAARVACLAQDGVGDRCKGVQRQPKGGDGVTEIEANPLLELNQFGHYEYRFLAQNKEAKLM